MPFRIELVVVGGDLNSDEVIDALVQAELDDLNWSAVDDLTIASFEADFDPVCRAVEVANRITHQLPNASVPRINEDLVSSADVANRTGVNRETVRLWSTGARGPGNFPLPRGRIGGGDRPGSKIWAWRDVDAWLRTRLLLELDPFESLAEEQAAEINARLANPTASYLVGLVAAGVGHRAATTTDRVIAAAAGSIFGSGGKHWVTTTGLYGGAPNRPLDQCFDVEDQHSQRTNSAAKLPA
jgi:hypothetical protein